MRTARNAVLVAVALLSLSTFAIAATLRTGNDAGGAGGGPGRSSLFGRKQQGDLGDERNTLLTADDNEKLVADAPVSDKTNFVTSTSRESENSADWDATSRRDGASGGRGAEAGNGQAGRAGGAKVPGVRIQQGSAKQGQQRQGSEKNSFLGALSSLPSDSPFASEAGMESTAWPILSHLMSLLKDGRMDEQKRPRGAAAEGQDGSSGKDGGGATASAPIRSRLGHVLPDLTALSKVTPAAGSISSLLEFGLNAAGQGQAGVASIDEARVRRSLRSAYESDSESRLAWDALSAAALPTEASSRHACVALTASSAGAAVDAVLSSLVKTAQPAGKGLSVPGIGTAATSTGTGKETLATGGGTGSAPVGGAGSNTPADSVSASVRASAVRLAEVEYRAAVRALLEQAQSTVHESQVDGKALTAPARGMPAQSAVKRKRVGALLLPPRPFLVHEDGKISLHGKPVVVLGASAGFAAARIATGAVNSTVIAASWGDASLQAAMSDDVEGDSPAAEASHASVLSAASLAYALKESLGGLPNLYVSDLGAGPEEQGALPAVLAFIRSYTREKPGSTAWMHRVLSSQQAERGSAATGGARASHHLQHFMALHADSAAELLAVLGTEPSTGAQQSSSDPEIDPLEHRFELGALVIPSLRRLHNAHSSLPHEFEARLASILVTARTIVLPADLPESRFFSYWQSTESMLRSSAEAAGLVLTIRSPPSSSSSGSKGWLVVTVQSAEEAAYEASLYERARAAVPSAAGVQAGQGVAWWEDDTTLAGLAIEFCPSHLHVPALDAVHASVSASVSKAIASVGQAGLTPAVARAMDSAVAPFLPSPHLQPTRAGLVSLATASAASVPLSFAMGLGLVLGDARRVAGRIGALDVPSSYMASATQADVVLLGHGKVALATGYALNEAARRSSHARVPGSTGGAAGADAGIASGLVEALSSPSLGEQQDTDATSGEEEEGKPPAPRSQAKAASKGTSLTTDLSGSSKAGSATGKTVGAAKQPSSFAASVKKFAETVASLERREAESGGKSGAKPDAGAAAEEEQEEDTPAQAVVAQSKAVPKSDALNRGGAGSKVTTGKTPASKVEEEGEEGGFVEGVSTEDSQPAVVEDVPLIEERASAEEEEEDGEETAGEAGAGQAEVQGVPAEDEPVTPPAASKPVTKGAGTDAGGGPAGVLDVTKVSQVKPQGVGEGGAPLDGAESAPQAAGKAERAPTAAKKARGRSLQELPAGKGSSLFSRKAAGGARGGNPLQAAAHAAAQKQASRLSSALKEGKEAPGVESVPGAALPIVKDQSWSNIRPVRAPATADSTGSIYGELGPTGGKRLSTWAAELGAAQARLVEEETPSFRAWWRTLASDLTVLRTTSSAAVSPSVLVQGRRTALLSAKLARMLPSGQVLSVKAGQAQAQPHTDLLKLLNLQNNLLALSSDECSADEGGKGDEPGGDGADSCGASLLSHTSAVTLGVTGEQFDIQLLQGEDVWAELIQAAVPVLVSHVGIGTGEQIRDNSLTNKAADIARAIQEGWEQRLGALLRLAGQTHMEVQPFAKLTGALRLIMPLCHGPCALLGPAFAETPKPDAASGTSSSRRAKRRPADVDGDGYVEGSEPVRSDNPTDGFDSLYALLLDGDELLLPQDAETEGDGVGVGTKSAAQARTARQGSGAGLTESRLAQQLDSLLAEEVEAEADATGEGGDEGGEGSTLFGKKQSGLGGAARGGRALLQLRGAGTSKSGGVSAGGGVTAGSGRHATVATLARTAAQYSFTNPLANAVIAALEARYTRSSAGIVFEGDAGRSMLGPAHAPFWRVYGPVAALVTSSARAAALLETASASFSLQPAGTGGPKALPRVFVRFSLKDDEGASHRMRAREGLTVHTLLSVGVQPQLRARLARLMLSLPLPAIVRGAVARGYAVGEGKDGPPLVLAPWHMRLVPDPVPACGARLQVRLPALSGSVRTAPAVWESPLCLRPPAEGEDIEQDVGHVLEGSDERRPGWEQRADAPTSVRELWAALASQMHALDTASGGAPGRFSAVEYGSGSGSLSLAFARAFPEATVLSVESDAASTDAHMAAALRGGIGNNIIARGTIDSELMKRLHDSPEFFRFQVLGRDIVGSLARIASGTGSGLSGFQQGIGTLLALAATTFVRIPPAAHLSLAFTIFGDETFGYGGLGSGARTSAGADGTPVHLRTNGAYLGRSRIAGASKTGSGACAESAPSFFAASSSAEKVCTRKASSMTGIGGLSATVSLADLSSEGRRSKLLSNAAAAFAVAMHPRPALQGAELRLLGALVRAPGGTTIRVAAAPIPAPAAVPNSMDEIQPPASVKPSAALGLSAALQGQVPLDGSGGSTWPWLQSSTGGVLPWPGLSSGLVRIDVANLTRHVNHHFQSDIDGHSRKYTLRVRVNATAAAVLARAAHAAGLPPLSPWSLGVEGMKRVLSPGNHPNHGHTLLWNGVQQVTSSTSGIIGTAPASHVLDAVNLLNGRVPSGTQGKRADGDGQGEGEGEVVIQAGTVLPGVSSIILSRDMDNAFIPYDTVYGITLITGLRLGLLAPLRTRAYHQFVSLPLYQDMAPWNIVFTGAKLDYIDFDTKDRTYDAFVPKAYEVMEVLFNYKRTLEDFKRCGGQSSNPYNFPFVSDCVGSSFTGPCKDSAKPVPCGDGTCRSDYVSCLRAISDGDRSVDLRRDLLWAFKAYDQAKAAQEKAGSARKGGEGEDEEEENAGVEASAPGSDDAEADEEGGEGAAPGQGKEQSLPKEAQDGGKAYIQQLFGVPGKDDKSSGTSKVKAAPVGGPGKQKPSRLIRSSDLLAGVIKEGTLEYGAEGVRVPKDSAEE